MNCPFELKDDHYVCPVCDYRISKSLVQGNLIRECTSRGLGDTIARAMDFLGIPKCGGCGQRQQILNEVFPYKQKCKFHKQGDSCICEVCKQVVDCVDCDENCSRLDLECNGVK